MGLGVMTVNIKRLPECADEEWALVTKTIQHAYDVARSEFGNNEGAPNLVIKPEIISTQMISDQDAPLPSTKEWVELEYISILKRYGITHVSVLAEYTQLARGDQYGK
ncbi:MAG: hypothetical protein JRM72_01320 [Nitrososphaerota archaeon]|nr:hypothetical protein [Nitrososphaerota archaeon]